MRTLFMPFQVVLPIAISTLGFFQRTFCCCFFLFFFFFFFLCFLQSYTYFSSRCLREVDIHVWPCYFLSSWTALRAFMRTEVLCISVLTVASGPRVKLASCKSALNPPVVCSTVRSKAVVPVLVLLFVALWFILRGDLLYVFPVCHFCSCVFQSF